MASLLRAAVALPKQTFQNGDYVIDISYIENNLIVGAGPTDGFVTRLFRDRIELVVEHLDRNHGSGNWHIWNLRAEGIGYSENGIINGHVTHRGVGDHQAVNVEAIEATVQELEEYLSGNPKRVAFIHCKEGKGRLGSVICGYLMYKAAQSGVYMSVEEAISKFTCRRMRRGFGPGVSIRSQVRFLHYWQRFLQSRQLQENFRGFSGSGMAPYDERQSVIAKAAIIGPHRGLQGGTIKMSICRPDSRLEAIFSQKLLVIECYGPNQPYDVSINIPLLKKFQTVKLEFLCQLGYAYAWANLYFETLGDSHHVMPFRSGCRVCPGRFLCEWDEFDGYRGTAWKSPARLFRAVELLWSYVFGG